MPAKILRQKADETLIADPVAFGRELALAGKQAANDGYEIIEQLRAELPPWQEPIGLEHAQTLAELVRTPDIRGRLIEQAQEAVRRGRWFVAGLAFAELRHTFRDWEWVNYISKEYPCGAHVLAFIEALIGEIVYRQSMLHCTGCGAELRCTCGCGRPYLPDIPFEAGTPAPAEPNPHTSPALERAMAAIQADPGKSNRLIAQEIGVTEVTVRRAWQKLQSDVAVDVAVVRTGADGRTRHLPRKPNGKTPPRLEVDVDPDKWDLIQDDYMDDAIASSPTQRWEWSLGNAAGDAISMQAFWSREFGDWQNFIPPQHLVELAEQAAASWAALAQQLKGGRHA